MAINKTRFEEYLACYGPNVSTWPEEARLLGQRARQHPEFAVLLKQEERFEQLLRSDHVDPMPPQLVQRVLTNAFTKPAADEPRWLVFFQLPSLRPATIALMLLIGFAIGYGAFVPEQDEEAFLQSYSDDAGAAL